MRGRTRPRTNDEWIAKRTLADEIPGDSNRLPAADDVVLRPDIQGRHQAENEQKGCYPAPASRVRRRSIVSSRRCLRYIGYSHDVYSSIPPWMTPPTAGEILAASPGVVASGHIAL